MKRLFMAFLVATLAGCAVVDDDRCIEPSTRDAGMGVQVPSCKAWLFGPTRTQRERFERAHGLPASPDAQPTNP